ncbi:YitT family protein [Bacillus alveayuensis]|uniref:YitT family protein n=1 Tax=Aeribacillus alveayuensis TaxID=279215 RepID=UPI0005CD3674|nr:YitT family protein [Bacillus alveayuensis]
MLRKAIAIIVGSMLLGIGINVFLVPYELLDGGIIGISLIIKYVWNVQAGLTIILLSIPLYIMAWVYYRPYFYNSLHGMLFSSFMIDVLSPLRGSLEVPILFSSIIGGVLVGAGIGLMLRYDTSTGGTDLLAQFISKLTNYNVGILIFIIDGIVIVCGSWIVGHDIFLYSVVVVTVVGAVTTMLTSSVCNFAK